MRGREAAGDPTRHLQGSLNFMHSRLFATTALIGSTICQVGCSQDLKWSAVHTLVEERFPTVSQISTDSLAQVLADSTQQLVLLDTRTRGEYEISHIRGAVHLDPDTKDFAKLDTLDRQVRIVTYCSVGYRSSEMAARLADAGFMNVSNVRGSIFKWANEGRTVVRGDAEVREVHPFDRIWGKLLDPSLRAYEPGTTMQPD